MFALVALLFAQVPAPALTLPPSVQGEPGKIIVLRVDTAGKSVRFYPLDKGLDFADAALLASPKLAIVTAARPGKYRVLAYSSVNDQPTEPSICIVEVVGAKPDEVTPVTPGTLQRDLRGIYDGINEDAKLDKTLALASTLKAFAATPSQAKNVGAYFLDLQVALNQAAIPAALKPIRERLGREIGGVLGSNIGAPLTPELAAAAGARLTAFGDALIAITQ